MVEHHDIKNPKDDSINFVIYDTPRWNDKIELLFKIYISNFFNITLFNINIFYSIYIFIYNLNNNSI